MEEIFNNLTELIKKHDNILIMTHRHPDFDGMGSAIALQQIIHSFNKTSYIIINSKEKTSLIKAYNYIDKNGIYFNTIKKTKVLDIINEDTLLFILDTHKQEMLEMPSLISKLKNIVILDHHIKSKNYIKTSILNYINSNLSSTVEFITNYIKYLNKQINPLVATILLVGLEIDTNNYKLKNPEKAYETAAYLSKLGADNVIKQELLQQNIEEYLKRQKFIEKSYMINDNIAMCTLDNNYYTTKDLASIALELLQFENVSASFVIGYLEKSLVGISSRSIGQIDVEKIMSKMGGGGHINLAATQISNKTIEEVKQELIKIIGR